MTAPQPRDNYSTLVSSVIGLPRCLISSGVDLNPRHAWHCRTRGLASGLDQFQTSSCAAINHSDGVLEIHSQNVVVLRVDGPISYCWIQSGVKSLSCHVALHATTVASDS